MGPFFVTFSHALFLFVAFTLTAATRHQRDCPPYTLCLYSNAAIDVYIRGVQVPQVVVGGISCIEIHEQSCDDVLLRLHNDVHAAPVGVSAIMESAGETYATSLYIKGKRDDKATFVHVRFAEQVQHGVKPLFGITTNELFDPTLQDIDFSTWTTPGVVDYLIQGGYAWFNAFRNRGAFPIHWNDGPMKKGVYGMKLCNPLGHTSQDAQTVLGACYEGSVHEQTTVNY